MGPAARRVVPRKLSALALLAATYCIVSGGPFGLEDIVGKSGYPGAFAILIVTPIIWSLPTALMVSELSAAIPLEGGFYAWVQRAMGPFWGFQEAWLTLTGSVFDMAIYPTLFAAYVGRLWPALTQGHRPLEVGTAMIVAAVVWNLFSARAVGRGSIFLSLLFLSPFLGVVGLGLAHGAPAAAAGPAAVRPDVLGGIMIAMWNYMGWDNASTVAGEVDRPSRTYPRVMFWAVPLVAALYLVPVGAMAHAGVDRGLWATGGWVDIGRLVGGVGWVGGALAAAVMVAGALSNFGTFNALSMSLTRLPMVMAEDGYLPRAFGWRHPRTGVPVVSLLVSAVTWGTVQWLGFERVIIMDVLLSGLSVVLEFWALVILRIREPGMRRPFTVPGGLWGAVGISVFPTALIVLSVVRAAHERMGSVNGLVVGFAVLAAGPLLYALSRVRTGRGA